MWVELRVIMIAWKPWLTKFATVFFRLTTHSDHTLFARQHDTTDTTDIQAMNVKFPTS